MSRCTNSGPRVRCSVPRRRRQRRRRPAARILDRDPRGRFARWERHNSGKRSRREDSCHRVPEPSAGAGYKTFDVWSKKVPQLEGDRRRRKREVAESAPAHRLTRLACPCEPNGGAPLPTASVGIPRMAMPPVGSQLAWNQDSGLSRTANTSSAATSASTPAPDTGINRSASSAVGTSKAAFSFR